jgi:hypothetical protein
MITELVFIELRKGITRDEVMALYRQTAPAWAKNPDLITKYYISSTRSAAWVAGCTFGRARKPHFVGTARSIEPESVSSMEASPASRISTP